MVRCVEKIAESLNQITKEIIKDGNDGMSTGIPNNEGIRRKTVKEGEWN